MTKEELRICHGTPDEFEAAVWKAANELFCTDEEARVAIAKYRAEYDAAPEKPMSNEENRVEEGAPLPARKLATVRQALYDAKFALEQELHGDEKLSAIRVIMHALDLTVDPYTDVKPMTDEQLAVVVAQIRAADTQGAAERFAMQLAESLITPSMTKALALQDASHKRVNDLLERITTLEEEVRSEKQKVARLAMRGK